MPCALCERTLRPSPPCSGATPASPPQPPAPFLPEPAASGPSAPRVPPRHRVASSCVAAFILHGPQEPHSSAGSSCSPTRAATPTLRATSAWLQRPPRSGLSLGLLSCSPWPSSPAPGVPGPPRGLILAAPRGLSALPPGAFFMEAPSPPFTGPPFALEPSWGLVCMALRGLPVLLLGAPAVPAPPPLSPGLPAPALCSPPRLSAGLEVLLGLCPPGPGSSFRPFWGGGPPRHPRLFQGAGGCRAMDLMDLMFAIAPLCASLPLSCPRRSLPVTLHAEVGRRQS